MLRSILRERIRARLYTTGVMLRAFSNQTFMEEGYDITTEQFYVLSLIADNKELYQRQLSEITLKDRANISRIIKILLEKELITKTVDSNGRKIYKVKLTKKGEELYQKVKITANKIRQIATKNVPKEEMEICLNTLDKIFYNLEDKVTLQI